MALDQADQIAGNGQDRMAQNQAIAAYVKTFPDIAFATPSEDGVVEVFV